KMREAMTDFKAGHNRTCQTSKIVIKDLFQGKGWFSFGWSCFSKIPENNPGCRIQFSRKFQLIEHRINPVRLFPDIFKQKQFSVCIDFEWCTECADDKRQISTSKFCGRFSRYNHIQRGNVF